MDGTTGAAPRRLSDLGGPRGWPLLGNLLDLEIPRLHQQLEGWAGEHGPVYRLRMGLRDALVVARPDLIDGILRDRPDGWRRLPGLRAVIQEMGLDGLFSAEGDTWRRQRRLVTAAFTPSTLKRYFPLIERITERLKEQLGQAARDGAWIDLQAMLMRYTVDVTASLAFGVDVNTLQHGNGALQENIDKIFPMLMRRIYAPFPLWRYVKRPADRVFDQHLAAGHEAVSGFIQAARERIKQNPALAERPTNLLEAMLVAQDADGAALSEAEVTGNVFTMLLAGEDTTANTLAWTLHLLHQNPEAWRALVQDVDDALGADAVPHSFQQASGLAAVEACANESMRLRPVAPFLLLTNNAPAEVNGIVLPAGTSVFCLMRSGAVDASVAADAAEFRPSRWRAADLAADETAAPSGNRQIRAASTPFGAGPRVCPGRYLAMLEMKMVLAAIARNFDLVEVSTEDGTPPRERLDFTMAPVGLRMKIKARAAG